MKIYRTSEIAEIVGIHPNTVRLYEKLNLISKPERLQNGYRIFTEIHLEQCKLIRVAFQVEVLQNGLRKKMVSAVKTAATGNLDEAIKLVYEYLQQVEQEQINAEKAIEIVGRLLSDEVLPHTQLLTRKQVAKELDISVDTLRNWEANGLLSAKRKSNGYRVYTEQDVLRLKIIRSLRCANYSLEAILRLLQQLSKNTQTDLRATLNTPSPSNDIVSVCDRLIVSLTAAKRNAYKVLATLQDMKAKFR